jgi:hypothetical protein
LTLCVIVQKIEMIATENDVVRKTVELIFGPDLLPIGLFHPLIVLLFLIPVFNYFFDILLFVVNFSMISVVSLLSFVRFTLPRLTEFSTPNEHVSHSPFFCKRGFDRYLQARSFVSVSKHQASFLVCFSSYPRPPLSSFSPFC